jgi:hypothetical protein
VSRHPIVRAFWWLINAVMIISLAAVVYGAGWEYSTRSYLKGFSDAIIPASDDTDQKIEAILQWMAHGPERRSTADAGALPARDPEATLNVQQLLNVCGTATNAFVNLAQSSGLRARRLLLLDDRGLSKHVVVEVLDHGRWLIVDPSYRVILRLPDGSFPTRADLKDPAVFRAATQNIPNYPPIYSYETTVHVRLARIPWIGKHLRGIFNFLWPTWEESINWTLLVERESFAMLIVSLLLLFMVLAARFLLAWYCRARLGIARNRLRDQILRRSQVVVGGAR